jgi:hypothetical protein
LAWPTSACSVSVRRGEARNPVVLPCATGSGAKGWRTMHTPGGGSLLPHEPPWSAGWRCPLRASGPAQGDGGVVAAHSHAGGNRHRHCSVDPLADDVLDFTLRVGIRQPVAGGTWSWQLASRATIASTAPEPPSMWPVAPLIPLTRRSSMWGPKTLRSAMHSAGSLVLVAVPCTLTYPTSLVSIPASSMASRRHAVMPGASSGGMSLMSNASPRCPYPSISP